MTKHRSLRVNALAFVALMLVQSLGDFWLGCTARYLLEAYRRGVAMYPPWSCV